MAIVVAKVIGGSPQNIEVGTVGDVKTKLNAQTYTATVNGNPVQDSYVLKNDDFVSLAPAVKGA